MTFVTESKRSVDEVGVSEEATDLGRVVLTRRIVSASNAFILQMTTSAAVDRDHSFRLQAGEIAGDQFSHRANLRRQFLVADWQMISTPSRSLLAFLLGEAQRETTRAGDAPW